MPQEEAAVLAQCWTLVAQGRHDDAAAAAERVRSRYPRSVALLSVIVEIDIVRRGAVSALSTYESWLGTRSQEEPGVLRRVARAYLYEWGRQTREARVRAAALAALAEDGDAEAQATLSAGAKSGNDSDLRALAKLGDSGAIDSLAKRLKAGEGLLLGEIHALSETRGPRAAAALAHVLADSRPENRAAAADALGQVGDPGAVPRLRPLLDDPHGAVRVAAAGALFRLGDFSGTPLLLELAASEHATVRRSAAILLASQPDETWMALVRGLASDPDPSIRLDAARLLAPHDPVFARELFDRLMEDTNLAIREQASMVIAEAPESGLATLRKLLRTGAPQVKVRAAERVLELTR
jgi:HEAT repeat protein